MKDRIGFLAGCADALTEMCGFYLVAAFILSDRWGLHIGWMLLCTVLCSTILTMFLQKQRPVPLLAALAAVLFGASLTIFILKSATPMSLGYVIFLVIGAGIAMGCTMNYVLNRPSLMKHLTHLDVIILALMMVVLCREALEIPYSTILCILAVVLLNGAAVIGLRMTEGAADTKNALKASMVALCGAVAMVAVVAVLVAVFSRSGSATDAVLQWLRDVLHSIGAAIQRFMEWLVSGMQIEEIPGDPMIEAISFVTEAEQMAIWKMLSVNPMIPTVIAAVLVVIAAVRLVFHLRKNSVSRGTNTVKVSSYGVIRQNTGMWRSLWAAFVAKLRFYRMAFIRRNTPAGVLVYLERRAKRCRTPRKTGESMRAFAQRLDPAGGLDVLADALDREYYGRQGISMSARECRQTRHYIRKVVQHG